MSHTEIIISDAERQAQKLSDENAEIGRQAILRQGYVILRQAVPASILQNLGEKMEQDLARLLELEASRALPYNWVKGHVTVQPPPMPPYLYAEVLANPFAMSISDSVHRKYYNCTYDGLAIMPGTPAQPVHADHGQLWPDLEHPHPPVSIIVNIPLIDTTERNGAIELWPGTHLDRSIWKGDDIEVPDAKIDARRAISPPVRGCTEQGDVLMRDMRMWHRGMPNESDETRIMLVTAHHIFWRARGERIRISPSAQAFFDALPLETVVDLQPEGFDYLIQHEAYKYVAS